MRYIIDRRDNRIMHICGSHYGAVRETLAYQKERERAREIYKKINRDIPTHYAYVLATVESHVVRARNDKLKDGEFTIITEEPSK